MQYLQVFTKQGTDRRKYKKNDMVVVKISKTKVNIGEVRSVNGEDLEFSKGIRVASRVLIILSVLN